LAGSGGNGGRDGGAQTSRGALTVQNARMLHDYHLQLLGRKCSCNKERKFIKIRIEFNRTIAMTQIKYFGSNRKCLGDLKNLAHSHSEKINWRNWNF
jgi:hypothetical protein